MLCRWMFCPKKGMWAGLFATILLPSAAHAFKPFVVKDIRVEGLHRLDVGTVFAYLPIKVGETFTEARATESVHSLYRNGLFNDVCIKVDRNVVVVVVDERATIASLNFSGMHEFDAKAIKEALQQVGFAEGRIFDHAMLERAELELKQQYLDKGKYGVEVTPTITPLPRNRVGISFDIFEGKVARIRQIHFVGNRAFSARKLRDQLKLTTPGWLTWYTNSDKYSREKLEGDLELLRSFYLDRGYLEMTIAPPQVTISPDRQNIYLTFTLNEGEPYKVRSVKLAGDLLGLDHEIEHLLHEVKVGATFSAAQANDAVKAITDYLGERGYAFAQVNFNPQLDRTAHEADLVFFIDPKRRVYVNRIQIGGNTRTRDEVIRREMRQKESAWYDAGEIKTSRDRLNRLGYFGDVNVKAEPLPGSTDQVNVNIDVKEKPTGLMNFGVGYDSQNRVGVMAGISQDNILGSGDNLSLQLNTSQRDRTAEFLHTNPYWTQNGVSRTSFLYYRQTNPFLDNKGGYRIKAIGTGMNFGIPISEYDRIVLGASFERNQVHLFNSVPAAYQQFVDQYGSTTNAVIFTIGWNKNTLDNALAPTRGYKTMLQGNVSGADLPYTMLSAQHQYYLPLGRDYTLAFNGIIDWGHSYRHKNFPIIKNVYGGGIGSVRGYKGASLGPRDLNNGDYIGGSRRLVANMQLYLPFPGTNKDRSLRWFIFTDAGRVMPGNGMQCTAGQLDQEVDDPCGWRYSAGVGLSWHSPLGLLQLSYGKPISPKQGDDTQTFQFQVGTAF